MKFKKVLSAVAAASMAISAAGALSVSAAEMPGITADYVKGDMPENMFGRGAETASRMLANNFDRNDACIQNDLIMDESKWSEDAKCFKFAHYYAVNDITGKKDVHADCAGPYFGFVGIWHNYGANFIDKTKNYVFSVNAKNISDIPCALDIALSNGGYGATSYSNEYKSNGKTISSDDYETFKATIKAHPNFDASAANYLALILPVGTKAGAKLEFKFEKADDVYFGEEQAYDIRVNKMSDSDILSQGQTAEFGAEVVNQIETVGNLSQNFTWKAMNKERTEFIDSITIAPSADTSTAAVTIGEQTPDGDYDIVAVSNDYEIAKGASITVGRKTPKITLLNASQFSGYVDLSARVENVEGMISFAIGYYSADGRLLGADLKNVNAENANAECSITSSKAYETGTLVKIYVWSGEMQPISNPDGFVSQLTIE